MATYTTCPPYASIPAPTSYRTRCRNNSMPGGCQNQHCSFYHGDVGMDQQVSREDSKVGLKGMEWRTRKGSQGGWAGDELSNSWNGLGGQGGSITGEEVNNVLVGGRKRNNSWGSQTDDPSFYKEQKFERNSREEIMRKKDYRSNGRQVKNEEFQDCRDSKVRCFIGGNSFEIEENVGNDEQKDKDYSFGGNGRLIVERGRLPVFGENSKNYEKMDSRKYKYRERAQGPCSGDKEEGFGKPNIIQHNKRFVENLKKRNFSAVDSDMEAESSKFSRKKRRGDIDLRLEKNIVETFDFPENLIGLLLGKKGATISRIKTLSSPAVITVPQSCNSRGFREIKLEGFKMQIEKAKGEIYKTFKELRIEHIVETFGKYVGKSAFETDKYSSEYLVEDTESKLKIEALKIKINCMDREKQDLQNKVSMLTSTNSGLVEGKNKFQYQISQLNKVVEFLKDTIKSLELENKNSRMEKDFNEAANDKWKNISLEQTKRNNFEIETLANELVKKNLELESRDVVINDLEQTSETRMKEILKLKSEMERDSVQCDKCEEKFRSNELLKRHDRFRH